MTPSSLPHRGPHAVFTADELQRILHELGYVDRVRSLEHDPVGVAIVKKIDVALSSDPKFRTPTS